MRAFIALPIDLHTTRQLQDRVALLQQTDWGQQLIWFPPENYHLTLQFLGGKLDPARVQALVNAMPKWFTEPPPEAMRAFHAAIGQIEAFPERQHAHTLIATVPPCNALNNLRHAIETQTRGFGFTPAQQTFRPHISLGRIPKHLNPLHLPHALTQLDAMQLEVNRIILYQSELTDSSPLYTPLAQCHLNATP